MIKMNLFGRIKRALELHVIRNYKEIDGWLTLDEALALYRQASLVPRDGIIVEIGSWKGKSTYCLAKGLKKGKIYAIDPFDASGEEASAKLYAEKKGDKSLVDQFNENMSLYGVLDKICVLVGCSSQYLDKFSYINLLFIDGDHSMEGCNYDFDNFHHHVVSGGYIVFHDFDTDRNDLGPTDVVKNKIMNSDKFRYVGQYDSLWITQKI